MDMMRELVRLNHEVIAIGQESTSKWRKIFRSEQIRYISIKFDRNGLNPISDIYYFLKSYIILRREKPDRVFLYQSKPIIYGSIAAKLAGVKNVYSLVAGLGSIIRKNNKFSIIKIILSVQYHIALKLNEKVMFQNRDDLLEFVRLKLVSEYKAEIINGSGVNMETFKKSALVNMNSFLFVGRVIRDKGVLEYLQAARQVKRKFINSEFILIGPFDSNPTALSMIDLKPYIDDGTIKYIGESDDVRSYYEKCSVFVLPSYHEGTPKSILEAMAIGRAVITSDAPGCRETVIDGVTGFLVEVRNVKALVLKMEFLIENEETCKSMGQEGYNYCKNKYDVRDVNKQIRKIIRIDEER